MRSARPNRLGLLILLGRPVVWARNSIFFFGRRPVSSGPVGLERMASKYTSGVWNLLNQ